MVIQEEKPITSKKYKVFGKFRNKDLGYNTVKRV